MTLSPLNSLSSLAVVIPARSGCPHIKRTVENLRVQGYPEIVVVWDGTPTVELEGVTERELPAGSGAGRARNRGVASTAATHLLFVDSDVLLGPGAYPLLQEGFSRWHGFIGSYDQNPRGRRFVAQFRDLLHHHVHQQLGCEVSTFFTGVGAVTREAWASVGGFGLSNAEDVEFGYRLRERGISIGVVKELQGSHCKEWTLSLGIRTDLWVRAIPWVQLLLRGPGRLPGSPSLDGKSQLSVLLGCAVPVLLALSPLLSSLTPVWLAGGGFLVFSLSELRFFYRVRGFTFLLRSLPLLLLAAWVKGVGLALGVAVFVTEELWGGFALPRRAQSKN